jgi:hypothetical protein
MAGAGSRATGPCSAKVSTDRLPQWAQEQADAASKRWKGSGQPAGTNPPHAVSAEGDFMAIMAPGRTLRAPARDGVADMIQFIARRPPAAKVTLEVRRNGTAKPLQALSDGYLRQPDDKLPIGMDKPGCYRFTFTWEGFTRSVDLQWLPGPHWSAGKLPAAVNAAVTLESDLAQNKQPGGGYQPPPGEDLSPYTQWVRSTRSKVTKVLGPLPTSASDGKPDDPAQIVYVAQIPYDENDQADIRGLVVVVGLTSDGHTQTLSARREVAWFDLSLLGTPHIHDQTGG